MAKKNSLQKPFLIPVNFKEKSSQSNNYYAGLIQQLNSIKLNTVNPLQILLI
ncbi:MAG: hypothetical protein CM1200mP28_08640 [Deltaproteobacteria bacterium]|nr:MAG: hypothetical protein CM1200mP28_08640 [Deltaproteobacteria bacterium]